MCGDCEKCADECHGWVEDRRLLFSENEIEGKTEEQEDAKEANEPENLIEEGINPVALWYHS